jgi:hypothetical protein
MAKLDPEVAKAFHDIRNTFQAFMFHFKQPEDCTTTPEDAIAYMEKDLASMHEAENAIGQGAKGDHGSVYGATDMILCANPLCYEIFKEKGHKKYHSPECKDDHHRMEREAGKKVLARGKIHAALLERSPRLQRVAWFLSDGKPHSTREILRECDVCAVNAIADELREPKNGFDIDCERIGRYWYYTMKGGQSQLLRIAK